MGKLIEGVWSTDWYKNSSKGSFVRPETRFRECIGGERFPVESGRYHLYVSLACPWAHRTLMVRSLLGLEKVVSVTSVSPKMSDAGWHFGAYRSAEVDPGGREFLREVYTDADAMYTGRVTVPVLWDKEQACIVNNESREIMRMMNDHLGALGEKKCDLSPLEHRNEIDEVLDAIYEPINNGVYRTGFASSQQAYERAFDQLFDALEFWNKHLQRQDFMVGEGVSEADIALFTTLYRFDPVYHGHFKCNRRRIEDFDGLWGFLRRMLSIPGVRETCDIEHIKDHYYWSHPMINPTRVVPKGPSLPDWY